MSAFFTGIQVFTLHSHVNEKNCFLRVMCHFKISILLKTEMLLFIAPGVVGLSRIITMRGNYLLCNYYCLLCLKFFFDSSSSYYVIFVISFFFLIAVPHKQHWWRCSRFLGWLVVCFSVVRSVTLTIASGTYPTWRILKGILRVVKRRGLFMMSNWEHVNWIQSAWQG